jgi:hypothetical protein
VAIEHHGLGLPFWPGLVSGLPEAPGLSVDLNLEGIEANLRP